MTEKLYAALFLYTYKSPCKVNVKSVNAPYPVPFLSFEKLR